MQSQPVSSREENFWFVLHCALILIGAVVLVLMVPKAIRFFPDDPIASVFFLVAAVGWIISIRFLK